MPWNHTDFSAGASKALIDILHLGSGLVLVTFIAPVFGTYQVSPKSLVASVTLQKGSSSKWRQLIKQILRVETNIIFLIVENIHPKIYDIM